MLNLKSLDDVCGAVKTVWASIWKERIISFMSASKPAESIITALASARMCVILQVQLNSVSSGICFSVNPTPGEDRDNVLVEAIFGQGQGIVDGSISPDTWTVNRETKLICGRDVAEKTSMVTLKSSGIETVDITDEVTQNKPALTDEEIVQVASYALKLEAFYGCPQDMEYAVVIDSSDKRAVKVLQTRPITTLDDEWLPDPVPMNMPPSPFTEPFEAPDPARLYLLDHIHVGGPLSLISANASVVFNSYICIYNIQYNIIFNTLYRNL